MHVEKALCLDDVQIVVAALGHLIYSGALWSREFDVGGRLAGKLPGLRRGWILGRSVDLSDIQWREFRAGLPALTTALLVFVLASRGLQWFFQGNGKCIDASKKARTRAYIHVSFALIFLTYLHGLRAAYVVISVGLGWVVSWRAAGTRYGSWLIWGFHISLLLLVRFTNGLPVPILTKHVHSWYTFSKILEFLALQRIRWQICFNLTFLRMLSFGLDLHWWRLGYRASAHRKVEQQIPSASQEDLSEFNRKKRQKFELFSESDYSLILMISHALYPPLYLAGPVITYQDYVWQLRGDLPCWNNKVHLNSGNKIEKPFFENSDKIETSRSGSPLNTGAEISCKLQTSMAKPRIALYAARFLADLVCLELVTHFLYFNAIAINRVGPKIRSYGVIYDASHVGLTAWWVLSFMWLKFATFWRYFRLISLLEGIDPPENMVRCFANNYDIESFWKGWHASYNRWLVRYMYVPMGGNAKRIFVIWPIFMFVALWHDLELRLVSWAWIMCLAFLPELMLKNWINSQKFDFFRKTPSYLFLCGVAAAVNIFALMLANMIGFVVGPSGAKDLLYELAASPFYIAIALLCFFSAAQLMFSWRK